MLCLVDCFSNSLLLCDPAYAFFCPFSLLIPALFILCPCPTEEAPSVHFTNSELITSADGSSFAASVSILNGIFCTLDSSELEQQYRTSKPAELEPSDDIISRINCSTQVSKDKKGLDQEWERPEECICFQVRQLQCTLSSFVSYSSANTFLSGLMEEVPHTSDTAGATVPFTDSEGTS